MVVDKWISLISFRLDRREAPHVQIVRQVEQALHRGYLRIGDELPKVAEIVAKLSISPHQVLRAYRELERRGIACREPGRASFVVSASAPPP